MKAAVLHRQRRRSPMPAPRTAGLAPRRGAARARTASRAARPGPALPCPGRPPRAAAPPLCPAPPAPLITRGAGAPDRFSPSRPALPEHARRRPRGERRPRALLAAPGEPAPAPAPGRQAVALLHLPQAFQPLPGPFQP